MRHPHDPAGIFTDEAGDPPTGEPTPPRPIARTWRISST